MTVQEKFIKAYDMAKLGIKTKLKDLYGSSTVDYVVKQCRDESYTKNDVVEDMHQKLIDIAQETKDEAIEMYNQIESI